MMEKNASKSNPISTKIFAGVFTGSCFMDVIMAYFQTRSTKSLLKMLFCVILFST